MVLSSISLFNFLDILFYALLSVLLFFIEILLCTCVSYLEIEYIYIYFISLIFLFFANFENICLNAVIISIKSAVFFAIKLHVYNQQILAISRLNGFLSCFQTIYRIRRINCTLKIFHILKRIIIIRILKSYKTIDHPWLLLIVLCIVVITDVKIKYSFIKDFYTLNYKQHTIIKCSSYYLLFKNLTLLLQKNNSLVINNLLIKNNQILIIYGPNGSGKTSLLKACAGLNDKYLGNIKIVENIFITSMLDSDKMLKNDVIQYIKQNPKLLVLKDEICLDIIRAPMVITCVQEYLKNQIILNITNNGYLPVIIDLYNKSFDRTYFSFFKMYDASIHINIDFSLLNLSDIFIVRQYSNIELSDGEFLFLLIKHSIILYKNILICEYVLNILSYDRIHRLENMAFKYNVNIYIRTNKRN